VAVKQRWENLSPRTRTVLVVAGAIEGMLKIAALADLRRRSGEDVRGPRGLWAVTITLANSAGLVPISYFLFGRRKER
jgi:hypothetical protein